MRKGGWLGWVKQWADQGDADVASTGLWLRKENKEKKSLVMGHQYETLKLEASYVSSLVVPAFLMRRGNTKLSCRVLNEKCRVLGR